MKWIAFIQSRFLYRGIQRTLLLFIYALTASGQHTFKLTCLRTHTRYI